MRKTTALLLGTALLCFAATAGAANKYPPGPGGTCPDSVKIEKIQNNAAVCHPAVLDTVLGVGGVIVGFDAKASAFGFYIQHRGVAINAGLDIFTGATNYNSAPTNLALGDSVVVYGTVQDFQGESEIEGPDVSQSTDDIIVRKVSSGNALPAFFVGTVSNFNQNSTNTFAEQYEGMLVRIASPMRVARTSLTGNMPFNSFILVNQTGSATDSVLIDGNTLATFTPPALGTTVSQVQGIINQRTTAGVNTYRIQIRDGNDINVATPPNMNDVFAVEDNKVRVLFDRNITLASAENEANYSLASLGDVLLATQVNGTTVELTIDNGLNDGDIEGVTVNGLVSSGSGIAMTTPQSRSFVNGVVEPALIQQADPAFLAASPCQDRSRFAGAGASIGNLRVSFRGTSVADFGTIFYLVGASGGARNGVSVFGPTQPLNPGHRYLVVGNVQEFGSGPENGRETEVVSTVYIVDEGVAPGTVTGISLTVHQAADTTCDNASPQLLTHLTTGEDYEGQLVKLNLVRISEERQPGESFFVTGPQGTWADTILVANQGGSSYTFDPDSLDVISITGVLSSNSLSTRRFRINPRSNADIVIRGHITAGVGDPSGAPKSVSFAVAPNPAKTARITFGIPKEADVEVAVYDLVGRKIATLEKGRLAPGTYSREWGGLDSRGKLVSSGMYFYKLRVGDEVQTVRGIKLN